MARSLYGRREYNLASRFLDELPDVVDRERLRPTSWSGYGSERQLRGPSAPTARETADFPDLQTGDSVRHGSLGEGVVTRIEPGGLVTVRFANDGSERKLMLEYAPLEKI
jgi:DNA helicase-2/ATP-dependent DNA helicase PcrA